MDIIPLTHLGFTKHERTALDEPEISGNGHPARVLSEHRGMYRVHDGNGELAGTISGKLRYISDTPLEMPAVGDWVTIDRFDDQAVIHHVLPRRTLLVRKTSGRDNNRQVVAANLDIVFVVQGLDAVNIPRLERYLAAVYEGGARPVVLLTKADLCDPEEVAAQSAKVESASPGLDVRAVSALDGSGGDIVAEYLTTGFTCCFVGSSGVGKSTLINQVAGSELMETADVREGDRKGRHTTTHRQLLLLSGGGILIDTPGMREFGIIGVERGINETFPEIAILLGNCKFTDCSHTSEPGCAVLEAIESGDLDPARYGRYLKLQRETAFHDTQTAAHARRAKERKFKQISKDSREITKFRKRNR